MPLKSGKQNIGTNIAELMKTYKKKGKIGSSKPQNKSKALKQAIAIALSKARKKKVTESFEQAINRVLAEAFQFKQVK
jgi:flavin-binding protein dodecin